MNISGETSIIGYPLDYGMGYESGYVYGFIRRYGGTWEELQKLTPTDGEAGGWLTNVGFELLPIWKASLSKIWQAWI